MVELPFCLYLLSSSQPLSKLQAAEDPELKGQLLKLQPASGTPLVHGHHHNPCKQPLSRNQSPTFDACKQRDNSSNVSLLESQTDDVKGIRTSRQ
jgi:hypothetical protein